MAFSTASNCSGVITRCTSGSTTVSSWRRCSSSTSRRPVSRMSRALRCSSHGCSTSGGEPVADRRHQRVDVGVLLAHGAHLDEVGVGAASLDGGEQNRPVVGVLRGVVVVQRRRRTGPAGGEGLPRRGVAERGGPHRRRERREVAAERVVHDVHAGDVVGPLGDVRLAGQVELRVVVERGGGSGGHRVLLGGRAGSARGWGARPGSAGPGPPWPSPLGRRLGAARKPGPRAAGHRRRRHRAPTTKEHPVSHPDPTTVTRHHECHHPRGCRVGRRRSSSSAAPA